MFIYNSYYVTPRISFVVFSKTRVYKESTLNLFLYLIKHHTTAVALLVEALRYRLEG